MISRSKPPQQNRILLSIRTDSRHAIVWIPEISFELLFIPFLLSCLIVWLFINVPLCLCTEVVAVIINLAIFCLGVILISLANRTNAIYNIDVSSPYFCFFSLFLLIISILSVSVIIQIGSFGALSSIPLSFDRNYPLLLPTITMNNVLELSPTIVLRLLSLAPRIFDFIILNINARCLLVMAWH